MSAGGQGSAPVSKAKGDGGASAGSAGGEGQGSRAAASGKQQQQRKPQPKASSSDPLRAELEALKVRLFPFMVAIERKGIVLLVRSAWWCLCCLCCVLFMMQGSLRGEGEERRGEVQVKKEGLLSVRG